MPVDSPGLSLFQLSHQIKKTIDSGFAGLVWVKAEISELHLNRSGHCYLDLIEKDNLSDKVIARARATIWANSYRLIKPYFESTTRHRFEAGIKVLIQVSVEFHELYGLSLNIRDIDPTYTLGDLARKRLEIIEKLKSEGVYDMNKTLPFPVIPKIVAVISSSTAAGYGDFIDQLKGNAYGYQFNCKLFEAVMQGDGAEESVMRALDKIFQYDQLFDLVVIIRGGGAAIDLGCFDNYNLASYIAQFPLPVVTGIGHDRDQTILDLVAHTSVKTPTAAAELIIDKMFLADSYRLKLEDDFSVLTRNRLDAELGRLQLLGDDVSNAVSDLLQRRIYANEKHISALYRIGKYSILKEKAKISSIQLQIRTQLGFKWSRKTERITHLSGTIAETVRAFLEVKKRYLDHNEKIAYLSDPLHILKKGYSLTYSDNKLLTSARSLKKGSKLLTRFNDGEVESEVLR